MSGRIDIVSASAGSGKTTRLARELESAVTEKGISPDRIVAMTFTRKAAAELVGRGRDALLRKGRPDDAELFAAARIGTVNAVAGMLVAEFAFEAGVSPELIVLDETRANEAFQRSLGDVVSRDDLDELARLSGRFDDFPWLSIVREIADAARMNHLDLEALNTARDRSLQSFFELFDRPRETADVLDARLETALEKAIAALQSAYENGSDRTKKSNETLLAYERAFSDLRSKQSLPWSDWADLMQRTAAVKSDPVCEPVRQAADVLLRHPGFREDNELAIRLCFDLARRALAAYQRFKVARRAIDFIDQETIALSLLAVPEVQEVLREEIALVLVDEFQDSSPLELAFFLALSRIAPHSVWVGDQKQAIYGFRGADPALMEDVVDELLTGREPETLKIGRRSRAPLVRLMNKLFVPPFADAGLSAARVELEPANAHDPPELGPCLERWRLDGQTQAQNAAELGLLVRHFLDDPDVLIRGESGTLRQVQPRDVAILCRRRETCLAVAAALGTVDVQAEIALSGLLSTPEGRIACAALRLWVYPDDMLARAEIVFLLDPTQVPIDTLVDGANADRWRDVEPIARVLTAREQSPCAGALEAFDAVARALQLDDLVMKWDRGRRGIANIDALRAHAVTFVRLTRHRGGVPSPAGLVAYLEGLVEGADDVQAASGGANATSVTTWHAAKGLEWPVVVLYEIDGSFSRSALGVHVDDERERERLLENPLAGRTIRYWPSPFRSNRSPLHARLFAHATSERSAERASREELRLLYVGFSRVRDRLILASSRDLAQGTLGLFMRGGGANLDEPVVEQSPEAVRHTFVNWGGIQTAIAVRKAPTSSHFGKISSAPKDAWVLERPASRTYAPAFVAPSSLVGQGSIADVVRIGNRVFVQGSFDTSALGNAIHGYLAADQPVFDDDDRHELATRLIDGWRLTNVLKPADLVAIGHRFSHWLNKHVPEARLHREWPVEHRLPTGTILRGKLDLVAIVGKNLSVVDHKVILANDADALEEIRLAYGQLRAYADALLATRLGDDVDLWVHLPLAGLMARFG